ncbi:MAG: hypothetical protein SNI45_02600 [Rikenellaceae bacterium]
MRKVHYNNQPSPIEAVGNGSYLYRWGISQIEFECANGQGRSIAWECYQTLIGGLPTENLITERVMDALWGGGVEQKLINDYNASLAGLLEEDAAEAYLDFLVERQALKVQIAKDFAQWTNAM